MSAERSGGVVRGLVGIAAWFTVFFPLVVGGAIDRATAFVPECIGDCSANHQVTVDELVRGVNIALETLPVDSCPIFDRNTDEHVTIDELIAGVNAALQGCYPVTFRGLCRRPGAIGLITCAAGSAVRLSVCLDRTRCLVDAGARRLLGSGVAGADGRFSLSVDDPDLIDSLLVLESDVDAGVVYRSLGFGPPASGVIVDNLHIDPLSEAVARIIDLNGLALFSDSGLRDLFDIILSALSQLNFAGLTAEAAATLATNTASQDAAVQGAIDLRRFTPTPTHTIAATATVTQTPTTARTATVTATSSVTTTPSSTRTPTASSTATATPTLTATPSLTSTRTVTLTATPTVTATATPSITLTPTPSSSPTPTLPPLNVAIEVNPDPIRPGEIIDATFTITNSGGSSIQGLTMQAVLPMAIDPFLDAFATAGGRCGINQVNTCNPGDTISWNFLGGLDPGTGITLHVPAILSVGTPNGTPIAFSAHASATGLEAIAAYSAEVQSAIAYPYDLAIEQDSDPVQPGARLTYTMTYGFRAVVGQANSVLRLHAPNGTTVVSASDGGTAVAGGDIEWGLGTLKPGDGGVRRLTVQVDASTPVGSLLPAQATIRRSDNSGAKRANLVGRVQAAQALRLAIETAPDPARPGDSVDESVTITNPSTSGAGATLEVVVEDLVDSFVDNTTLGGGICGAFSLGNSCDRRARVRFPVLVPPKDGITVHLNQVISAATQNGAVARFRAYLLNGQNLNITTARSAVRVETAPSWDLTVDEDRDPVGPGDTLTYHLTTRLRPSEPASADGVLSFTLPNDATLVAASDGGMLMDGTVHWDLDALAPGTAVRRDVTVQVENDVVPASALGAEALVQKANDPLAATRVHLLTRTAAGVPLSLATSISPLPARPGEPLETELTVTNTGASALSSLRIEARLPDGIDAFSQGQSPSANCSPTTLQCSPREVIRWTIGGELPAGGSATVRMPPLVSAGDADGTLLHFQLRATDLGGGPTDGRNSVLSRTVVVEAAPSFDLALTASPNPVTPGQMLTYTLHYGRLAAASATAAVLHLQLPPNVYFVSATGGGVAVGDDAAEWNLGALAGGEEGSVELSSVVDAVLPGTALHAGATLRDSGDLESGEQAEVVTIAGTAPLAFAISAAPDPVAPGGLLTISLSVTNNGTGTYGNLSVEGLVPQEANTFLDNTTTGHGSCGGFSFNNCPPGTRVAWNIPSVGPHETVTVSMPPTIRANVPSGTVIPLIGRLQISLGSPPILATGAVTVD